MYKSFFDEAAQIINRFVAQNCGAPNGYDTYVCGEVRRGVRNCLDWRTPRQDDLRLGYIKQQGMVLNDELLSVLDKYPDISGINISRVYLGDGCYRTELSVYESVALNFYG